MNVLTSILQSLLAEAEWTYDRANSYAAFHQPGADYVCLARSQQLTVKLYRFNPKRYVPRADAWGAATAVNPHSHRYAFQTMVLTGSLTNIEYRETTQNLAGYRELPLLRPYVRYTFRSGLGKGGEGELSRDRDTLLVPNTETYSMPPGQWYHCGPDTVHSVVPHWLQETVVVLFQHADVREQTYLYSRPDEPLDFQGLYQPLEVSTAREIISTARSALERL